MHKNHGTLDLTISTMRLLFVKTIKYLINLHIHTLMGKMDRLRKQLIQRPGNHISHDLFLLFFIDKYYKHVFIITNFISTCIKTAF